MRENAYHKDKGGDNRTTDRHCKDRDEDILRDVDIGKWVIGSLSTPMPAGSVFITANEERDGLSVFRSTPSLEDGRCNCTILTGKDVV